MTGRFAQRLDQRLVRDQRFLFRAAVENRRAALADVGCKLGNEPRLPDPGLAAYERQLSPRVHSIAPRRQCSFDSSASRPMSGPRDRPATSRAGRRGGRRSGRVPATQLGREQPDRSRGRDPELPPQALDEPLVQSQRACAVPGVGQQAHQVAVSTLVEWIERGPAAAETDRALQLASSRGVGRQAPEHRADVRRGARRARSAPTPRQSRPAAHRGTGPGHPAAVPPTRAAGTPASPPSPPRPARCARGWQPRPRCRSPSAAQTGPSAGSSGRSRRARLATAPRRPSTLRGSPGATPANREATSPGGAWAAPARPRRAPPKAPR